jgi:1,5-anhydro-D-fructose reductase (1,5-anhydro-D-mannitol-forming)
MTTGWAILGTGRHPHLKVAPALHRAADARLVAVLSRDQARADHAAAEMGADRGYADLDALLSDPAVDAVWVCSPNALHASQTMRALEAGKHVLCEKPMALTAQDADAMVEAAKKRGLQLGVGFHLRHHPGFRAARDAVRSGALGEITYVRAQWALHGVGVNRGGWWAEPELAGAGILMGTGVHAIDLLRGAVEREVVEAFAWDDRDRWPVPLDVTIALMLKFEGGVPGQIVASRRFGYPLNDFAVYGDRGHLIGADMVWEELRGSLELATAGSVQRWEFRRSDEPLLDLYAAQAESFMRAMAGDERFEASGEDGAAIVRITEAVIASARSGRPEAVAR